MANRKKSVILFSLLALTGILVSACTQPYSNEPLEAPTVNPTTLFVSPLPTSDNPMAMVEELSTGTALAETAVALTAGTPPVVDASVTATPRPRILKHCQQLLPISRLHTRYNMGSSLIVSPAASTWIRPNCSA